MGNGEESRGRLDHIAQSSNTTTTEVLLEKALQGAPFGSNVALVGRVQRAATAASSGVIHKKEALAKALPARGTLRVVATLKMGRRWMAKKGTRM